MAKQPQITYRNYKKYEEHLCHSLNNFIRYTKSQATCTYDRYLVNPESIHTKEEMTHVTYYSLLPVCLSVKENLYKLPTNILQFCYPLNLIKKDYLTQSETIEVLCHFRKFCFDKSIEPVFISELPVTDWNLITVEEMNQRAKTDYIFDFSVEKVKTINDIIMIAQMKDTTGNLPNMESNLNVKIIIDSGIRNLVEFGYLNVNNKNIFTDMVYSRFFKSMLYDNIEKGFDEEINYLLDKIEKERVKYGM